ncbi:unnamed protein product [Closterium sp. Yama58-4]|nr:unnamed protein product [Closterium sp. Yama58-4]
MLPYGISSDLFSGAPATNVGGASVAGRKRGSPEVPTGGATAALQWQHGMQTPGNGCYSRSELGHMNQSGVLEGMLFKDADAVPVGAVAVAVGARAHSTVSPLRGTMAVAARQHMHLLLQQQRLQQQQQQKQRFEQASHNPLSPEARNQHSRGSAGSAGTGTGGEGSARTGSGGAGLAGGPTTSSSGQVGGEEGTEGMRGMQGIGDMEDMEGTGQWQSDEDFGEAAPAQDAEWSTDALDDPKRHKRCAMQDDCGTDDEWLPRCQGVRSGSAPNQRIKSRSMAERRRRERISEGLQRLRAKVRGRGDTCAMLDRAVGYVDALERRVMELEQVVMAAAGSGRNVFPGNAFAGGSFAGRNFARNVFVNNAAALTTVPATLTSVPTGLGGEPWLDTILV